MRPPLAPDAALAQLREDIERIDAAIIELIARRVTVARTVGERKRALALPTVDAKREAAVVGRAGSLARDTGLPEEEIRAVFWQLIGICRGSQAESR